VGHVDNASKPCGEPVISFEETNVPWQVFINRRLDTTRQEGGLFHCIEVPVVMRRLPDNFYVSFRISNPINEWEKRTRIGSQNPVERLYIL
ncbi:hypothetical protein, partial [Pseudophaeobacter sp.]|uniref:hypothetical protein n=1 Tax=Pseudophaeobacter sp. TaxID=1971739 RepID=UPI00329A4370